jgi:hypothetical protein
VFTLRKLSDFRRSEIFRGYFERNFHGRPFNIYVIELSLIAYATRHVWYNEAKYQPAEFREGEAELVRVIGKALNMSLHVSHHVDGKATENLKGSQFIFVGIPPPIFSTFDRFHEYTRRYLSILVV